MQDGLDGLAGGLDGRGVAGAPAAEKAFDGDADVGGAEGELGKVPLRGFLVEGFGEVVQFWLEWGGIAYAS